MWGAAVTGRGESFGVVLYVHALTHDCTATSAFVTHRTTAAACCCERRCLACWHRATIKHRAVQKPVLRIRRRGDSFELQPTAIAGIQRFGMAPWQWNEWPNAGTQQHSAMMLMHRPVHGQSAGAAGEPYVAEGPPKGVTHVRTETQGRAIASAAGFTCEPPGRRRCRGPS